MSSLLFTLETAYVLDAILRSINIVARLRLYIYVARQEFIALKWILAAGAVTLVAPYAVSWIRISLLSLHVREVDEIILHDLVARCIKRRTQTVQMLNPF